MNCSSAVAQMLFCNTRNYSYNVIAGLDSEGNHYAPFSSSSLSPTFTVANNDSINFYWNISSNTFPPRAIHASFASNGEKWSWIMGSSHNSGYSRCYVGAGDRDHFYMLSDRHVAVIDVDSPSKITGRKPPTKYISEGLRGLWSYVDKQTVCLEFDVLHDRCICSCC